MARKKILVSSGGGINAGTPFLAESALFVQQASPPVANTGRLARLADAMESIIAPGVGGPATSLVIGKSSTHGGQATNVLYGSALVNTAVAAQGASCLLVGDTINQGAAASGVGQCVYIGIGFTLVAPGIGGARGLNVGLGGSLTIKPEGGLGVSASANVVIGWNAIQWGSWGVTIGESAIGGGQNVVVGRAALAAGPTVTQAVAIGNDASAQAATVSIGQRARADLNSVSIGWFADALGQSGISIGRSAISNGMDAAIVLGRDSAAGQSNECVIGGGGTPYWITQLRVGPLFNGAYPGLTWQLTNSTFAGNDLAAPDAIINCGSSTGNATGGGLLVKTGTVLGAGAVRHTLAERFAVVTGGIAGKPSIRLSNQISTPGAQIGVLLNSPVAGNPALWLEITVNGGLHYLPVW